MVLQIKTLVRPLAQYFPCSLFGVVFIFCVKREQRVPVFIYADTTRSFDKLAVLVAVSLLYAIYYYCAVYMGNFTFKERE